VGTFVAAAVVDYRLQFADQGKQSFVYRFRFLQTNGSLRFRFPFAAKKRKLLFSVSSVFRLWNSGNMEMET
jgi:hypothetical protein